MSEISAIAALPKAPRAPDTQSAPADAATGMEAMLFAALLAQTGNEDGADAQAGTQGNTALGHADAELTALPPAVAQNSADEIEGMATTAVLPQGTLSLAVLQAQAADTDTDTQAQAKVSNADAKSALAAKDEADTAEVPPPDEPEPLPPAHEVTTEKAAAVKTEVNNDAVDAVSASGVAADAQVAQMASTQQTAGKPADAVTAAASAVAAAPVGGAPAAAAKEDSAVPAAGAAQAQAVDAKARKTSDPAAQDPADSAAQDAKALPADKAAALADMADKTVRQATADTAVQARALPVQGPAQAPAPHQGDDGKSGSKERQQAQGPQPAPGSANTSAQADPQQVAQPASATHSSTQAPGAPSVAPVTAPTLPQAQAQAPAMVQVAQQMPMTAQPDLSALAVQIATQSKDGAQHFSIRLDPAELGRVDVRLSIDHAGHAQAHLSVEKPQTLDLLQRDRTDLERALKDSGIDLSQSGLNFSLKGQERHGEQPTPFKGRSRALDASLALDSANAAAAASIHHFAGGSARLDIRV